MTILEWIRATDRMMEVVDELSRQMGMKDITEFQSRIAVDDETADIAFLEMAEMMWLEHKGLLQAFYRRYFHSLSRERQWRVAYTTAGSFLDRSAGTGKAASDIDLGFHN